MHVNPQRNTQIYLYLYIELSQGQKQRTNRAFFLFCWHWQGYTWSFSDAGIWRMLIVHLIHFAPGGGSPVSILWPSYRLRRAGRKRILSVIRWKPNHQGNIHAFLGSGQITSFKGHRRISTRRCSALERHGPTSSAAAQLEAQIVTVRWGVTTSHLYAGCLRMDTHIHAQTPSVLCSSFTWDVSVTRRMDFKRRGDASLK